MGYLNAQPGDDALIQATGEDGTDQLPAPSTFEGTLEAIGQGVEGGINSAVNAFTDFDPGNERATYLATLGTDGPTLNKPLHPFPGAVTFPNLDQTNWQQAVSQQREDLEKYLNRDKQYQGVGAQTIGGVTKGLTEFAIGAPAGPLGAATVMGGATADDTYNELRAQGVDEGTAEKAATAQGSIAAVGAVLPFKLPGLATKLLGSAGINIGLGVASRGAQHEVLEANGYDQMASVQKMFDLQQMAADGLVGLGMGFGAHLHEAATGGATPETAPEPLAPIDRPPPSQVDAARVVADQAHAADSGPGTFTTPEAADLHAEVFGRAMDDVRNGRDPHVTAEEAQTLASNMVDNPARADTADAYLRVLIEDPVLRENDEMQRVLARARERAGLPQVRPPPERVPYENADILPPLKAEPAVEEQPAVYIPDEPVKPFYAMNGDELDAQRQSVRGVGKQIEDAVLGDEADAWRKALRQRDSSNPGTSDTGQRTLDEIESKLSEQERDALYGIGLPEHAFDEVQDFSQAQSDAEVGSPAEAAEVLARYMQRLSDTPEGSHPADWTREQQVAYSAIRRVKERIAEEGWDSRDIQKRAVTRVASRFNDPRDAEAMLGRFLKEQVPPRPIQKAISQPTSPQAEPAQASPEAPEIPPVSPDTTTDAMFRQLEAQHGDTLIPQEDGTEITVKELGNRMRQAMANADSDKSLMDAAVACFARTGGIA